MTKNTFRDLWVWIPPVAALLIMSYLFLSGSNRALFFFINSISEMTGGAFWENITILGDALVVVVLVFPFVRHRPDMVWSAILSALVASILTVSLKHTFDFPRPPGVLPLETFNLIGPRHNMFAFPSGHASTVFTLAAVFIIHFKNTWGRAVMIVLSILVALSRIAVGLHWPVDILAGVCVGWISALSGSALAVKFPWGNRGIGQKSIAFILLNATIILMLYHNTGYDNSVWFQRVISIVCLNYGGFEMLKLFFRAESTEMMS